MTEIKLWSAAPFISYDGVDNQGVRAEVKVVKGCGLISSIEESDKGKAIKVSFNSGHPKFRSSGWISISEPIADICKEAEANGEHLEYRIETRRKEGVDRQLSITDLSKTADVAKDNVHKALVAVRRVEQENAEWILSPKALTRMDEDPTRGLLSANDYSIEELDKLATKKGNMSVNSAQNYPSYNSEGSPWVTVDNDGNVKPGSAAVAVPLTIFSFLSKYFKDNSMTVDRMTHINTVKVVLDICNQAQMKILSEHGNPIEKPNLAESSHTRARALVFENMEHLSPLTEEILNDKKALEEWHDSTLTTVVKMWDWSIKEVEKLL